MNLRDAMSGSNLSGSERLILLTIAAGGEQASRSRLSHLTGLSSNTVGRIVKKLEADGWLRVERRRGEDGAKLANAYRVTVPA